MRYAPEPADVFLTVDPESGGVAAADAPDDAVPIKALITLALPVSTKTEAARKVGRRLDDRGFREAWAELEAAGDIQQAAGIWRVVATDPPKASNGHHPPLRLVDGDDPGAA